MVLLSAQVSDQLHNTTTSVIVNVVDDNDNAPMFTRSSYEVSTDASLCREVHRFSLKTYRGFVKHF